MRRARARRTGDHQPDVGRGAADVADPGGADVQRGRRSRPRLDPRGRRGRHRGGRRADAPGRRQGHDRRRRPDPGRRHVRGRLASGLGRLAPGGRGVHLLRRHAEHDRPEPRRGPAEGQPTGRRRTGMAVGRAVGQLPRHRCADRGDVGARGHLVARSAHTSGHRAAGRRRRRGPGRHGADDRRPGLGERRLVDRLGRGVRHPIRSMVAGAPDRPRGRVRRRPVPPPPAGAPRCG